MDLDKTGTPFDVTVQSINNLNQIKPPHDTHFYSQSLVLAQRISPVLSDQNPVWRDFIRAQDDSIKNQAIPLMTAFEEMYTRILFNDPARPGKLPEKLEEFFLFTDPNLGGARFWDGVESMAKDQKKSPQISTIDQVLGQAKDLFNISSQTIMALRSWAEVAVFEKLLAARETLRQEGIGLPSSVARLVTQYERLKTDNKQTSAIPISPDSNLIDFLKQARHQEDSARVTGHFLDYARRILGNDTKIELMSTSDPEVVQVKDTQIYFDR